MPEPDAVAAVVKAIAHRPSRSIHKTDLRPLLEIVDARFSKHAGGFAASPGFISTLLRLAERQGLLITSGNEPRVVITLTDAGLRLAGADTPGGSPGEGGHAPVAGVRTPVSRSDGFVDYWRAANLGPFMTVRTKVYEEIDRGLEPGPKKLKSLVREAVRTGREADPAADPKFPWSRVTQFIENLMRRRPVALSGGEPVALTWDSGSREVTDMLDDWQLRLDGELVLHLIDQRVELRMDDLPDLAGALYNGRLEADIERAFDVVHRLAEDGLIVAGGSLDWVARSAKLTDTDVVSLRATVGGGLVHERPRRPVRNRGRPRSSP